MWRQLKAFITVTEQAGFAKAAKKLGVSNATVTRYIQELETQFQTQLVTRTTRHISLTEQGEAFYRYALEIMQLNDEIHTTLSKTSGAVQGHIKIGLPASILHNFSQEKLTTLAQTYPDLSIEIIQGNHVNDLLSSHFDIALHCGPLPDVNFYYEEIGTWKKMLCAAPSYIEKYSTPKIPDELSNHHCIDHADNHTLCWNLLVNGKLKNIPISSQIKVNDSIALKNIAIHGLGIVFLPSFTINKAIMEKKLIPILEDAWPNSLSIYALYPLRKRHNKKIEIVIEALHDSLTSPSP